MQPGRNSTLIYGLLLGVWVLVVAWQVEEHVRVRNAARTALVSFERASSDPSLSDRIDEL